MTRQVKVSERPKASRASALLMSRKNACLTGLGHRVGTAHVRAARGQGRKQDLGLFTHAAFGPLPMAATVRRIPSRQSTSGR